MADRKTWPTWIILSCLQTTLYIFFKWISFTWSTYRNSCIITNGMYWGYTKYLLHCKYHCTLNLTEYIYWLFYLYFIAYIRWAVIKWYWKKKNNKKPTEYLLLIFNNQAHKCEFTSAKLEVCLYITENTECNSVHICCSTYTEVETCIL